VKQRTPHQIIVRPLVTEKAISQERENIYWFAVDIAANKTQIRKAIEEVYQVHVRKVHTLRKKGKERRARSKTYWTKDCKKAAVTLAAGERIDIV
jgi:large subunit ribosomal protein L23